MTSHALPMHFSAQLVLLSVLVATLAGYVSLDLTQRALRARRFGSRRTLVLSGAVTMGLGIWSMHFVAMLALELHRPVAYRLDLVAISMVAAVMGAGISLWVITRPGSRSSALFAGAGFMGAAAGAMHYCGMASMEIDAHMHWNIPLVGLSLVVAYGASLFALWLVFAQRSAAAPWPLRYRLLAAITVGIGVAGLHFTAMAAVSFYAKMGTEVHQGVNTNAIAAMLVVASAVMLTVLLAGAHLDQQRAALANDLTAVADVMREIGRSGDARASVCRAVCRLTDAAICALLEPDGNGNLVLTASHGMPDGALTISLAETSASGDTFASGERRFVSDVAADGAVVQAIARAHGVASALYQPVTLDDTVVGVIVAGWTRRVKRLEGRAVSVAGLLAAEAAFVIERADLVARLERLARTDELTGLPNRRTADEELARFLARASRDRWPLAVAMLDLDRFKQYNDTHGHAGGDRLLQAAAVTWTNVQRSGDFLARYGGEEFLAIFPGCALGDSGRAADRLRTALPNGVTCSVGVADWNGTETAEELVARADVALYAAKAAGRDRTVLAPAPAHAVVSST
jgi:diguanylate cyclase (GGDEF)-like protein